MFDSKCFLYKVCGIPSNSDVSVIDYSGNFATGPVKWEQKGKKGGQGTSEVVFFMHQ